MIRDYVEFKRQLTLYNRFSKLAKVNKRKAGDIEDEMSCIPSLYPSYVVINGKIVPVPKAHGDPKNKELKFYEQSDKKQEYEDMARYYQNKVNELDNIINSLPCYTDSNINIQDVIVRIYKKREGMENVAMEVGYSTSGLAYYIDAELKRFFNSESFRKIMK